MKTFYIRSDLVYPAAIVHARTHNAAYEKLAAALIERGYDDPRTDPEFEVIEFESDEDVEVLD